MFLSTWSSVQSSCYVCCLVTVVTSLGKERVCQAVPVFPPYPSYDKEFGVFENLGPNWEVRNLTDTEVKFTFQNATKKVSHARYLVYSKGARTPATGTQDTVLKMQLMNGRPCLIGKCVAGVCKKVRNQGPLMKFADGGKCSFLIILTLWVWCHQVAVYATS